MKNIRYIFIFFFCVDAVELIAQGNLHQQSTTYEWPADPLVRQNLEKWRDQKFGMIIHWGLYAVPGIIESWQLCSEDWIDRDSTMSYDDYKKWYWRLSKQFNPTKFDPDQWASAAAAAGMRYVVFTTKHHDGFSMFDTKHTEFNIARGPFANHPKSDVARHVFEAFRKRNFMIGAYFSKPDWHSEYFWWPKYATADRNVNYDIRKHPWRWNQFKAFTHNQMQELMTRYGRIDILWLDGGWVRPRETVTDEVRAWGAPIPAWSQHIDMPEVARMARRSQPGLLIVDRTVHGEFENYQTPEQRIPSERLDVPWESCITLGGAWGYVPNDQFKSSRDVIHLLVEVVAKGGNLLLGVGPDAQGLLSDVQVSRLREIGTWLSTNGEAIYNTRAVLRFQSENVFFTQGKDSKMYAIVCLKKDEPPVNVVSWKGNQPRKGSTIKLIGSNKTLRWEVDGDATKVYLPKKSAEASSAAITLSFITE
jgi:alpha-L-fucosidase